MADQLDRVRRMRKWCANFGAKPVPLVSVNDKVKPNGEEYGGKAPLGKGWGLRDHTDQDFIYKGKKENAWLKNGDMRNVGFQLGEASQGIADIDLDCEAAVERAADFFADLQPVEFGRGGVRTHMLLRLTEIPEDIRPRYTGLLEDGSTAIELRTGCGTTKDGERVQFQTMALGIHPDTGEKLVFFGEPPQHYDDFPSVPFSEVLSRFGKLCEAISARKVWEQQRPHKPRPDTPRPAYTGDDLKERIRSALPPLSQICAEYAGDTPSWGGL